MQGFWLRHCHTDVIRDTYHRAYIDKRSWWACTIERLFGFIKVYFNSSHAIVPDCRVQHNDPDDAEIVDRWVRSFISPHAKSLLQMRMSNGKVHGSAGTMPSSWSFCPFFRNIYLTARVTWEFLTAKCSQVRLSPTVPHLGTQNQSFATIIHISGSVFSSDPSTWSFFHFLQSAFGPAHLILFSVSGGQDWYSTMGSSWLWQGKRSWSRTLCWNQNHRSGK